MFLFYDFVYAAECNIIIITLSHDYRVGNNTLCSAVLVCYDIAVVVVIRRRRPTYIHLIQYYNI